MVIGKVRAGSRSPGCSGVRVRVAEPLPFRATDTVTSGVFRWQPVCGLRHVGSRLLSCLQPDALGTVMRLGGIRMNDELAIHEIDAQSTESGLLSTARNGRPSTTAIRENSTGSRSTLTREKLRRVDR